MAVFPWNTYSRIELTCDGGAVACRAQVRVVDPAHFEYEVLDITDSTVNPITKSAAMAQLEAAVAWQAAVGAAPADSYARIELQSFFDGVTIVVASKVNGNVVATDETPIDVESSGPLLTTAQSLLEAAHAFVVAAKSL